MTRDMTRLMRRTLGVGVTGALAVTALIVPAPAARAAGLTAGEQEYYSYYSLDSIHNAGDRGAGVTIMGRSSLKFSFPPPSVSLLTRRSTVTRCHSKEKTLKRIARSVTGHAASRMRRSSLSTP